MKVIFPTDENMGYLSKRGAHFGKAKYYTIVTLSNSMISDIESVLNPGHDTGGCGNAVENIMSLKPDAMVVSGIGGSPARGFSEAGLDLYVDQQSHTVEESIRRLIADELEKSNAKGTCEVH
jgi:predicted Fe-Mo cluster-binding NifX family protein